MCWHDLSVCCCCLPVRTGVFVIAGIHIILMGLVAAETLIHHGLQDEEWYKSMIGRLKHPNKISQSIILATIVTTGVLCNLLILLGTLFSKSLFLLPGLVFNMISTLSIGVYSMFIAAINQKSGQRFYLFLFPFVVFFLMLYFWVVVVSLYKKIRKPSKISPVIATSNHSLQALSESGHFESLDSTDRRHLYAARNDLTSGYMAAPTVRISPSSTPDASSIN